MKNSLYIICLFVLLGACKRVPTGTPDKPVRNANEILTDFSYLDAKCKIKFKTGDKDSNAKIKLRIRKDSLIWASITGPVGVEGFRTKITQDSVFIIDRIHDEYLATNFDTLSRILNFKVDYTMLQALLLGDMLIAEFDSAQVTLEENLLKIPQQKEGVIILNYLQAKSKKLDKLNLKDTRTGNTLDLLFKNYGKYNGLLFPDKSQTTIRYRNKLNTAESTEIQLDFSEVIFSNSPLSFPFKVKRDAP
jgi:hypothetical protein